MESVTEINRRLDCLHLKMRDPVELLLKKLRAAYESKLTEHPFELFEGLRSFDRQDHLFSIGASKARAGQSAHNFGLAVDIVPQVNGQWSWHATNDWPLLARLARTVGLRRNIPWDLCHIEYPGWRSEIRAEKMGLR